MAAAVDHLLAGADKDQVMMMEEKVILVDYYDNEIGSGSKKETHIWQSIEDGMLHRAFSVFLFTEDGKLILQQRAASKITFPLIWANTCCSHPLMVPTENITTEAMGVRNAARRKLEQELGIPPNQVPLDSFTWITRVHYVGANDDKTGPNGSPMWGEHEIDWILMCVPGKNVDFNLNPNEVNAIKTFTQSELKAWMASRKSHGEEVSPWFGAMEQSGLLYKWWDAVLGGDLKPVLERDVIHRQQDLEALALKRAPGSVKPPVAFQSCLRVTNAAGTFGPLNTIHCSIPHDLPKNSEAVVGQMETTTQQARGAGPSSSSRPNNGGSSKATVASTARASSTIAKSTTTTAASGKQQKQKQEEQIVAPAAAFVPGASAAVPKQGAYGKVKIHSHGFLNQVSHLDEVFTMVGYKLGLLEPVKVAALKGVATTKDYAWCENMLCNVSRSFAMVIQQLPMALRTSVCIFYLVLRGLDTVEDDMTAYGDRRDEKLNDLLTFFTHLTEKGWTQDGVGEGHELELLQNFDKVINVFGSLSPTDQQVIADICRRMGEGMAMFSGRNLTEGTVDVNDYNLYCHYVAGLVGHGLSHLFVAHGEDEIVGRDLILSNEMGLFLQKTNIIRDYLEDAEDGRAFWPRTIWGIYGPTLKSFKTFIATPGGEDREAALACLNHMIAEALTLAPRCLEYMERLKNPDIFKFCAIPQVMAIATLDALANNSKVFTGVVKIRKGQALSLMRQAGTMSNVYLVFLKYARSIAAAVPPHHVEAYAITSRAVKEIEDMCLRGLPPNAIALSPFFSTKAVVAVLVVLGVLLQHLYKRSKSAGWGDGSGSYLPRITDSWDVSAVVGVVACVAYLFAVGGAPLVFGRGGSGSGLTPPSSPARKMLSEDEVEEDHAFTKAARAAVGGGGTGGAPIVAAAPKSTTRRRNNGQV